MSRPEWIERMDEACKRTSQAAVARRIGYCPAVVSACLKGTYNKGDSSRVEAAFNGAYGGEEVECPAVGASIPRQRCIEQQRMPFRATNPLAVRLRRTCPECPNGGKR
jgi:hypothetical protein